MENICEFSGKVRMDHQQKNDKTERARGPGRKNKTGDRKGESNDSPEIPDRRITSDIPGLHSGEPYPITKNIRDFSGNKSQENGPLADFKK